ncbi:50S ribosomal protein L29 [Candidatus Nomurabacteria bacterium]|nr:50S ribosomal protein L29 [Candidatus Nomurabacteria bacterium]
MAKAKKNSKDNFKEMSKEELVKKLNSLREDIRVIRFKMEGAKSKNVKEVSNTKKDIARILTELKKK